MDWFEKLPEECPPKDAGLVDFPLYRLVKSEDITDSDFVSQRTEFPNKIFKEISECICRSISTSSDLKQCLKVRKFPRHRGKVIAKLELKKGDGSTKQTFRKNHYSWWRSSSFSIKNVIIVETDE